MDDKYKVSKSEQFLMTRQGTPQAPSYKTATNMSEQRKAELRSQVERGEFREGIQNQGSLLAIHTE